MLKPVNPTTTKLAVIGLGYVGLPIAVIFSKSFPVIGFDIDVERVEQLKHGSDKTLEVTSTELKALNNLKFTSSTKEIEGCNCYIISVPTPVDEHNAPDLEPLIRASETVGRVLGQGDVVIFESTVYPGCTEQLCVPILEKSSGLTLNKDFYCGYSPERINPGDKQRRIQNIVKITSGSCEEAAEFVNVLYSSVIDAGTFLAKSIMVAEAAKVIENTQRDLNIALMNELSMLFSKLGINTSEVLEAAATKWNFLPFKPGLVGGHCISVDPYYLTYAAKKVGHEIELVATSRRVNNKMGGYVVAQLVKLMIKRDVDLNTARVLILGLSFKEDCPDMRNSGVISIIDHLIDYGIDIDVYDPLVSIQHGLDVNKVCSIEAIEDGKYDAVIVAVAHQSFKEIKAGEYRAMLKPNGVLFDVKSILPPNDSDLSL
jgi:UDP-N-acetyl-D-glucosamine/UDP-N-acetyl-D-galactosamine dehydrogenase